MPIRRGEIYFVDFKSTQGREQAGYRPVLVVSSDVINRQPLVVSVVVGTSASRVGRDYPTNIRVSSEETGLPQDTVFLCFQIRSLDPDRFTDRNTGVSTPAGTMPAHRLAEVDQALKLVLDLS